MHLRPNPITEMSSVTGPWLPQMRSPWVTPKGPLMDAKEAGGPEVVEGEEEEDTKVSFQSCYLSECPLQCLIQYIFLKIKIDCKSVDIKIVSIKKYKQTVQLFHTFQH